MAEAVADGAEAVLLREELEEGRPGLWGLV